MRLADMYHVCMYSKPWRMWRAQGSVRSCMVDHSSCASGRRRGDGALGAVDSPAGPGPGCVPPAIPHAPAGQHRSGTGGSRHLTPPVRGGTERTIAAAKEQEQEKARRGARRGGGTGGGAKIVDAQRARIADVGAGPPHVPGCRCLRRARSPVVRSGATMYVCMYVCVG